MNPDYDKAAVKAYETLMKYSISKSPVSPLPILEQMENVIVVSFAELSNTAGLERCELMPIFGKNQDAVSSIHYEKGQKHYVVAYNRMLPFGMVQRALAREMGHIVLGHDAPSQEYKEEATCFAQHLLCPRPLIHLVQATGMRLTEDLLANLTGVFDQCLICMRRTPGTNVPANLNRFVRNLFKPFVLNFFDYYRTAKPQDGSALVDFGTFMDNYIE